MCMLQCMSSDTWTLKCVGFETCFKFIYLQKWCWFWFNSVFEKLDFSFQWVEFTLFHCPIIQCTNVILYYLFIYLLFIHFFKSVPFFDIRRSGTSSTKSEIFHFVSMPMSFALEDIKICYKLCNNNFSTRSWIFWWNFEFSGPPTEEPCSLSEFTCEDRTCIDLSQFCDRRYDCPDGSDELHCGK